ncbi:MAG TPA: sterol-binding protein [Burkholderiales bacterium]|nr:sterol-binding protein [Burkholderiales bacterium]
MVTAPFVAFVNHLLAAEGWARDILAAHAGRTAVIELFPLRVAAMATAAGTLEPAPDDADPAVVIRLDAATALRIVAEGEDAWRRAGVSGDTAFAADIARLAANLKWDAEEDLSRAVGDVAAHRMGRAARAAAAWPKRAASSAAAGLAEYLTEESRLLVTPLQAAEFVRGVDELRDAAERLDKRIERLQRLLPVG